MTKKIKVQRQLRNITYDLEGKVDDVIEILNNLKNHHADFEDFELSVDHAGYDGGIEIYLNGYREETDAEYNKRIKKEERESKKSGKTSKRTTRATRIRTFKEKICGRQ